MKEETKEDYERIVTELIQPSITRRKHDYWVAYRAGWDLDEPQGVGVTKQDAIEDLLIALDEQNYNNKTANIYHFLNDTYTYVTFKTAVKECLEKFIDKYSKNEIIEVLKSEALRTIVYA